MHSLSKVVKANRLGSAIVGVIALGLAASCSDPNEPEDPDGPMENAGETADEAAEDTEEAAEEAAEEIEESADEAADEVEEAAEDEE